MRRVVQAFLSVLMSVFVVSFSGCSQKQTSNSLEPQEFSKLISSTPEAVVLDVRTPEEFSEGHIANAKNINVKDENFEAEIQKLDKTKPYFVYCRSGARSAKAAAILREKGFSSVKEMSGGILKWNAEHLEVQK